MQWFKLEGRVSRTYARSLYRKEGRDTWRFFRIASARYSPNEIQLMTPWHGVCTARREGENSRKEATARYNLQPCPDILSLANASLINSRAGESFPRRVMALPREGIACGRIISEMMEQDRGNGSYGTMRERSNREGLKGAHNGAR